MVDGGVQIVKGPVTLAKLLTAVLDTAGDFCC